MMRCCALSLCLPHRGDVRLYRLYRQTGNTMGVFPYCGNIWSGYKNGRWPKINLVEVVPGKVNLLEAGVVSDTYGPGDDVPVVESDVIELDSYLVVSSESKQVVARPPLGVFSDRPGSEIIEPYIEIRTEIARKFGWVVTPHPASNASFQWKWVRFGNDDLVGDEYDYSVSHPIRNSVEIARAYLAQAGFGNLRKRRGVLSVSRDDGASELARCTGNELSDLWDLAAAAYRRDDLDALIATR